MPLISPERQYAINYEISRESPQAARHRPVGTGQAGQGAPAAPAASGKLGDDPVTLRQSLGLDPDKRQVSIKDFQATVGKDKTFVEATLRNKLAEYGLRPNLKLELGRDAQGNILVTANAPQSLLSQINQDLNNSQEFRAAFHRLSLNQPTLDYVANVRRLSSAYGANNKLFNSLISSQSDNNSLLDIANRYAKLKQTFASDPLASMLQTTADSNYRFVLNS